MFCFFKIHFNILFICSVLQNDFFSPGVQSKSCILSLLRVCHVPCPSHRLAFKIWALYFRLFSFSSYKEYGLFYSFCLLLIYSVESWLIWYNGQDLLLRKKRSCCYFAHSVRSVGLAELLELHVDFPNTSVLFGSSEFLLNVNRASSKKYSSITVFCQHCTCISIFLNWFVYFHVWTVHVDNIKSFIDPANAHNYVKSLNC
jgi:hypothetical protein